jgi:hypothetical protein
MEALRKDPSPNVFGRGALALAKLGALDAAWEILPRMHETPNVALRRQLAAAVGDLLGEPGEFYHLLNDEFRDPGSRLFRMAGRTIEGLRKSQAAVEAATGAPAAAQISAISLHIEQAVQHYELDRHREAIGQLHVAAMEMLRAVYGFAGDGDVAVEFALSRSSRFGVGLWVLQTAREHGGAAGDEVLRLDALLGFHFLYHSVRRMGRPAPGR